MRAHVTTRTWLRLTVLFAIASTLVTPLSASRLPDASLAWPVLLDDDAGGVYLQHRQSVYFVTAWHVLFDPNSAKLRKSQITLRSYPRDPSILDPIVFELDLATLDQSHRILSSKADDVAVVIIGDVTNQEADTIQWESAPGVVVKTQPGPVQLILDDEWHRFDEAKVSNDVFIFGYPTSLHLPQQLERGRPYLRKGVIAEKNRNTRRLIVDALVLPGNSGGPVIEIEEVGVRRWQPKFIGIVVGTLPYQAHESTGQTAPLDNSGYAVVAPVDSILDLIEKPPSAAGPRRPPPRP